MAEILYFAEKPGAPYEALYLKPFLERTGGRFMTDDTAVEASLRAELSHRDDITVTSGSKRDLQDVSETVTVYTNFYPRSSSRYNVFFQHGVADKRGMARVHTFKDQRSLMYRASMVFSVTGRVNPLSNRAVPPFRWLRGLARDRFDMILIPGQTLYDLFDGIGALRKGNHKIIGFPRLDPVLNGSIDRREVLSRLGLDPALDTVVYAPTWHGKHEFDMNSMSVFAESIVNSIGGDLNLIIRPHPRTPVLGEAPEAMEMLREKSTSSRRVRLVEDPAFDTMEIMASADLLISDFSSVGMEFLALDRPVVFVDHLGEVYSDSSLAEIRIRDAGQVVSDPGDVGSAISRGLEAPDDKRGLRRRYAKELFGPMDGKASERGASAILDLLDD